MLCSSCHKPKNELRPKNSKLMPSVKLFLCRSCIDEKFEPRWIIIIVGRAQGLGAVKEYTVNKRYCGETITVPELTP